MQAAARITSQTSMTYRHKPRLQVLCVQRACSCASPGQLRVSVHWAPLKAALARHTCAATHLQLPTQVKQSPAPWRQRRGRQQSRWRECVQFCGEPLHWEAAPPPSLPHCQRVCILSEMHVHSDRRAVAVIAEPQTENQGVGGRAVQRCAETAARFGSDMVPVADALLERPALCPRDALREG